MATAFKQVKNGAYSTVQAGSTIIASTSGTSITLGTGHGARFPSPGNGFWVTVWNQGTYANPADDPNMEIMLCTARSTDVLTVTRAQNGTSANGSIAASARVQILLQDQQFADLHVAVNTVEAGLFNGITSSDHLTLTSATSKLVKSSVLRQDDTTNTYQRGNTVTLTGWGQITATAASRANETVTFGVTFLAKPIVIVTPGGDHASATTYGSGGFNVKRFLAEAHTITTTSFVADCNSIDGTNWTAGNIVFYQWMAIGEL